MSDILKIVFFENDNSMVVFEMVPINFKLRSFKFVNSIFKIRNFTLKPINLLTVTFYYEKKQNI